MTFFDGFKGGGSTFSGDAGPSAPMSQGLSAGDITAMNAAGVDYAGPSTPLSPAESALMQPSGQPGTDWLGKIGYGIGRTLGSMSGTGKGGARGGEDVAMSPLGGQLPGGGGPTTLPFERVGSVLDVDVARADGGPIQPGQRALVGERGPEIVEMPNTAGSPAHVLPLEHRVANYGAEAASGGGNGFFRSLVRGLVESSVEGRRRAETQNARRAQTLLEAVEARPELGENPAVRKELGRFFGDSGETLDFIMLAGKADPQAIDKQFADALGVARGSLPPEVQGDVDKLLRNPVGARQVGPDLLSEAGFSYTYQPGKGLKSVTKRPKPAKDMEQARVAARFNQLRTKALSNGATPTQAMLSAAETVLSEASDAGLAVPDYLTKLATARTRKDLDIAMRRAARYLERDTARAIARESESGRREAALDTPMTATEFSAAAVADMPNLTPDEREWLFNKRTAESAANRAGMTAEETAKGQARASQSGPAARTPPKARETLQAVQQGMDAASRLSNLFDPAVLGPIGGRIANAQQAAGLLGMKEEEFLAEIDSFLRAVRLATTGQQASAQELETLRREVLNNLKAPEQFQARLRAQVNSMLSQRAAVEKTLRTNNERVPELNVDPVLAQRLGLTSEGPSPVDSEVDAFFKANPELAR